MPKTYNSKVEVRLPASLKVKAARAAQRERGGLSEVIRRLLRSWLQKQKGRSTSEAN